MPPVDPQIYMAAEGARVIMRWAFTIMAILMAMRGLNSANYPETRKDAFLASIVFSLLAIAVGQ